MSDFRRPGSLINTKRETEFLASVAKDGIVSSDDASPMSAASPPYFLNLNNNSNANNPAGLHRHHIHHHGARHPTKKTSFSANLDVDEMSGGTPDFSTAASLTSSPRKGHAHHTSAAAAAAKKRAAPEVPAFRPHTREAAFLSSLAGGEEEDDDEGSHRWDADELALTAADREKLAFLPEYQQGAGARKPADAIRQNIQELREGMENAEADGPTVLRHSELERGTLVGKEGDCVRLRVQSARTGRPMFVSTLLTEFGGSKKPTEYDVFADEPADLLRIHDETEGTAAAKPNAKNALPGAKVTLAALRKMASKGGDLQDDEDDDEMCFPECFEADPEEDEQRRRRDPFYSDPFLLDDPDIKGERRRKVMAVPGYRCSIVPFVETKAMNKDIDEQFYLRHPQLQQKDLKLTSIRKMKSMVLLLAIEENSPLEIGTVAFAVCYFERLSLKNLVTNENRKLVLCACTLLAVKFSESGISNKIAMDKKVNYAFSRLFELLGVSKTRVLKAEFRVYSALNFELMLPGELVLAQVVRLLGQINLTPTEYFRVKQKGQESDDDNDE